MNCADLVKLGYSLNEINTINQFVMQNVKITPQFLRNLGTSEEEIKRLVRAYRIITGQIEIRNDEDLKKHFRETNGKYYKITKEDLRNKEVIQVPRMAVIAGLTREPFSFWNSTNFKGMNQLYEVIDADSQKITVVTRKRPVIKAGETLELEGKIRIKGRTTDGKIILEVNRKYCRLCNRYGIVIEQKEPLWHFGCYKIIAFEGTCVYVSLVDLGDGNQNRARYGNGKLLGYGFLKSEAGARLNKAAKENADRLGAVKTQYIEPTAKFEMIEHS